MEEPLIEVYSLRITPTMKLNIKKMEADKEAMAHMNRKLRVDMCRELFAHNHLDVTMFGLPKVGGEEE